MIDVTVMYPYTEAARFDHDYYCNRHVPLIAERLGPACKGLSICRGLNGGREGVAPAFVAMVSLRFESAESFRASFGAHAREFMADTPNYT
jgi:uncharacterized protein (TIGR02118 family)